MLISPVVCCLGCKLDSVGGSGVSLIGPLKVQSGFVVVGVLFRIYRGPFFRLLVDLNQ